MGKEIPLVSLLCGVLGRKKASSPDGEAEKRDDNTDGGATQMPQDQLTKPSAAESTEDQARDTAQPTSNDQQVPLPPPPGRQQFLRAASCHHQPERSNSMTSKLVSSLSMRVSNGMPGRQFSRREDKPWSKDKKLKPEDSIWKKTIILGEKCRVRDDDEDNILYDEKGNKIATFHQKPQTAAMSFSRHTTKFIKTRPRNNITKPGGHDVIVTDALIHDLCPQSRNPDFCQYILSQFKGQPLFPKLLASLVGTTVIQAKTTTTKIWRLQTAIKDDRSELKLRTRNPSICLNTLDSLRGSRLFPKPLVVLGMNPMSMTQSHANRTATSIWDLYRSTANLEEGVTLPEDSSTSSSAEKGKLENKKAKDSEALYYIQTAVADHIFPRISVAYIGKRSMEHFAEGISRQCKVAETGEATWYIDSATSNHMTYNKGAFQTLDESFKTNVKLGDNHIVKVEGKGSVAINTKKGTRIINDVMYIPNLRTNLFSVGQMTEKGYTLHFGGDSCTIYDNKDKTLKIAEVRMEEHRCFLIHLQYMGRTAMKAQEDQSWLWHRRLGHFNFQGLKILHQKKMMTDLPQIQAVEGACEACLQGKQHKKSFPSGTSWRAKAVLELIHTDVCGPMRTPSHEQNIYFILFIDDYSRMTWVYFMREKFEVFKVFKKFKNLVEKQSGRSIKVLRSDRGKEYNNSKFDKFCEEEGIEHQTTVSYNPQQNGVSERKNRTVMEMARSMLQEKHLSKAFWAEAVYTAVYLLNRCPTKAVQNMTPIEAWSGKKPSAKHLRVSAVFAIDTSATTTRRNRPSRNGKEESTSTRITQRPPSSEEIEEETPPRRTKLLSDIYETCNFIMLEPENFETAVKHKVWVQAMEEEIKMIEKNNTWELADRPKDKEVIGVKWIYKTKLNADGSIQKYKARLVAKGFLN
ncbi:Retrovirus-related Pol polyprotein from transposon TNT 1-94 [Sesamum angolense]|uniref:Retrovirus-related Pol polyprotein from transposon TNT 1-94 n=1 Tax=Sesamum angolense TaxID=2727404 RepID=A0AAE1W8J5_9LAMI|nr:Retrovirus-related Pol polyprotein from transposon TNT 1-94 [Sesamum angolense]